MVIVEYGRRAHRYFILWWNVIFVLPYFYLYIVEAEKHHELIRFVLIAEKFNQRHNDTKARRNIEATAVDTMALAFFAPQE